MLATEFLHLKIGKKENGIECDLRANLMRQTSSNIRLERTYPLISSYVFCKPSLSRGAKKRQTAFSTRKYWKDQNNVSHHLCDFSMFHFFDDSKSNTIFYYVGIADAKAFSLNKNYRGFCLPLEKSFAYYF